MLQQINLFQKNDIIILLTVTKETKIIISFSHGGIIPVMKEGEVASIKVSLDEVTKSQWCFMHESCDDHEEEQEEKFMPVLLNAHKKKL